MKKRLVWGNASYKIIRNGAIVLDRNNTACFSEFMGRFNDPYDTIRITDVACEQTQEYHDFFLQFVIDMFDLKEASFGEDYFEFKSLGIKKKDSAVMSVVRMIWEELGNISGIDTPNRFFKRLMTEESPYEDKLKTFCHFYKEITWESGYFSSGHSWKPNTTKIRSTQEFVDEQNWMNVNSFFSKEG
jgi:hypothetical protein